jgi:hypothetical protein
MASRKMRRTSRKQRKQRKSRSRRMQGGMAPINDSLAGSSASKMSMGQGEQFASYHTAQHGGQAPLSAIDGSVLPQELHASAGVLPTFGYMAGIQGLRDPGQAGGRRRASKRKGRRVSKSRVSKGRVSKSRVSKRKSTRRSRRQSGGNFVMAPADIGAPDMLLDGKAATNALKGMNPEWALASDPKAFIPKA